MNMVLLIGRKVLLQTVRVLELFDKYPQFKNKDVRIDLMVSQLGEFVKFFKIYAKAYGYLSSAYEAEARLSLSAVLIHIELFCVAHGWDINMLRNEGYEHLLDKIKEVEAKKGEMI